MTNKQIKNLFPLSQKIRLYVPSTINVTEAIDNQKYVEDTLKFFGNIFGGATAYNAMGSWNTLNGELIQEPITIVESYSKSLDYNDVNSVVEYATKLCDDMKQESVAIEVNGAMGFIS